MLKMIANYGHLKTGRIIEPIETGYDYVVVRHRGSSICVPLAFTSPHYAYEVEQEDKEARLYHSIYNDTDYNYGDE